jgi:hypothetical protein
MKATIALLLLSLLGCSSTNKSDSPPPQDQNLTDQETQNIAATYFDKAVPSVDPTKSLVQAWQAVAIDDPSANDDYVVLIGYAPGASDADLQDVTKGLYEIVYDATAITAFIRSAQTNLPVSVTPDQFQAFAADIAMLHDTLQQQTASDGATGTTGIKPQTKAPAKGCKPNGLLTDFQELKTLFHTVQATLTCTVGEVATLGRDTPQCVASVKATQKDLKGLQTLGNCAAAKKK